MRKSNKTAPVAILEVLASENPNTSILEILESNPEANETTGTLETSDSLETGNPEPESDPLPETDKTEEAPKEEAETYRVIGRTIGSKDTLGFGEGTVTGAIIRAIASGVFTRKEIVESILDDFAGSNEAKRKATKTTISVTFSDVRSPFGKYHASRSLILREDSKGRVSFEPERYALVVKAIASGILSEIRGASTSKKSAILAKYGF